MYSNIAIYIAILPVQSCHGTHDTPTVPKLFLERLLLRSGWDPSSIWAEFLASERKGLLFILKCKAFEYRYTVYEIPNKVCKHKKNI